MIVEMTAAKSLCMLSHGGRSCNKLFQTAASAALNLMLVPFVPCYEMRSLYNGAPEESECEVRI